LLKTHVCTQTHVKEEDVVENACLYANTCKGGGPCRTGWLFRSIVTIPFEGAIPSPASVSGVLPDRYPGFATTTPFTKWCGTEQFTVGGMEQFTVRRRDVSCQCMATSVRPLNDSERK
jgi:hypothetical protein